MLDLEGARKRRNARIRQSVIRIIEYTILFLAIFIILGRYVFVIRRVESVSMERTLHDGQLVFGIQTKNVSRGDIIVFEKDGISLIKRVIGVPGDMLYLKDDGTVCVNDEVLDEPYVFQKSIGEADMQFPVSLGEDEFFVMGDNRMESIDSRSTKVGIVKRQSITGKIFLK